MSDEFETISVVETEPVEVASAEPVMADAPVHAPASEPVAEQPDADQRVFDNNPKIGSSEDNIKQDVAAENGTALDNGGSEGRAPVTARGREEAENKKQEARADLIEQMTQAEARRDFLNKDHDFGGMKMSGHDLDKLIHFYANNPQMQEQLKNRLVKSGKSEAQADKAVQDFNEYIKILKKESEGKDLTAEEKLRKLELSQNKDVSDVAQQVTQFARESGVKLKVDETAEAKSAQVNESKNTRDDSYSNAMATNHNNSAVAIATITNDFEDLSSAAMAKARFANAPAMGDAFASSASGKKLIASNDVRSEFTADAPVIVAVQAQAKAKPTVTVDTSFG